MLLKSDAALLPLPACGERSDCIADAIRVRGYRSRDTHTWRVCHSYSPTTRTARAAAPHPDPLPVKNGERGRTVLGEDAR
ncbi:hypothetical protein ACVILH_005824 [Bradyrhizobium sp. USDA 4353]